MAAEPKEKKQKKEKKEKKHKKDKKDKKDKKEKKSKNVRQVEDDEEASASDVPDRSVSVETEGVSSPSKTSAAKEVEVSTKNRRMPAGKSEEVFAPSPTELVPTPPARPVDVAPPSSRSQAEGKEVQPRVLRFLLTFNPLRLTVVWDDGGERKTRAIRVDRDEVSEDQKKFARVLVRKWPFLKEEHLPQVEQTLERLVSCQLPVYRVVSADGAPTSDAPGSPEKGPRLPPGTLFLVIERTHSAGGWWLRLANGQRWLREAAVESCCPSADDADAWLHSTRKKTMTRLLELNARLVCSQLSTQKAPVAPAASRPSSGGRKK